MGPRMPARRRMEVLTIHRLDTHTHTYALTMYTEDPAFRERPCIRRMNDAIRANSREHVFRTDQHFRDLLAAILVDDVTSKNNNKCHEGFRKKVFRSTR